MLVLLKSLEELEEEYSIEIGDSYLTIGDNFIPKYSIIELLGKVVETKYEKETDYFLINGYYFDPDFLKSIAKGFYPAK